MFCNDIQGCLTKSSYKEKVQHSNYSNVEVKTAWFHNTCVNWMPEIWYADESKEIIEGQINHDRKNLFCSICKDKKKPGYLLQCDFKNCLTKFHIRCAMEHGMIKEWEQMNECREKGDCFDCFVFCG